MSNADARSPLADERDPRPFGAQRTRSRMPLLFWTALFAAWFAILVWLAATQVGLKG